MYHASMGDSGPEGHLEGGNSCKRHESPARSRRVRACHQCIVFK